MIKMLILTTQVYNDAISFRPVILTLRPHATFIVMACDSHDLANEIKN